jgi:membrane associated rhomboid family serine protease
MPSFPLITRVLLIANVLVYGLQQMVGFAVELNFALWPLGPHEVIGTAHGQPIVAGFEPWQLITYSFLHGDVTHIAFNMLALWMFGGPVENALGVRRYTFFYFACVLGAAFAQLATTHFFQPGDFYPTLGASGGVFGLLLAFAILYPHAKMALIFFPVPVPAPIFVAGYMILELVMGVTGTQAGVAHFAHLGGALVGFVLIQYWRSKLRANRP